MPKEEVLRWLLLIRILAIAIFSTPAFLHSSLYNLSDADYGLLRE